jgi:hypothetical protein
LKKTVIAGALGECVHVAGVSNFLQLAESAGWRTVFLGPAVSIEKLLEVVKQELDNRSSAADELLVGISYRLTPETGERLLGQFAEEAADLHAAGVRFIFGGTPPVAKRAKALAFFERIFDGSQPVEEVLAFLKGQTHQTFDGIDYPQTTVERIQWKSPYPLLRHHFGLPTIQATLEGVEQIAKAKVLDVISLGIDQDSQENFFHPEKQDPRRKGAGGVPVRSAEEYRSLFSASRSGNYPLLRTYSGTDDFIQLAEMYLDTIHNAWCAIPLFWFNQMDGRGPWDLEGSIREHQRVITFYGQRGVPVELNEPHHWGMRDAPDVISVVSAFLSAYNAKHFGARDYIAQLMFNCPPGLSDAMDLAKMIAIQKMVEPLRNPDFHIWYQTRTGLLSYPQDVRAARAHLSASIYLQMALNPHIVHVVSQSEADHAATPDDVIEACTMAKWVIESALKGQPDMVNNAGVQDRADELVRDACLTIDAIRSIHYGADRDALTDPATLTSAVKMGILDAPQLKNNPITRGMIKSRIDKGRCICVNEIGTMVREEERIHRVMKDKERMSKK